MDIKRQKLQNLKPQSERNSTADRFDINEYLKKYENVMPKYNCRGERTEEDNSNKNSIPTYKKHTHSGIGNTQIVPAIIALALLLLCDNGC